MIFVDRAALEAALIGRRTYDVCTGITGGTVNDLDGKDVSSMPENMIFVVLRGSVKLEYILNHSAATPDPPFVVVPVDDATKHWRLASLAMNTLKLWNPTKAQIDALQMNQTLGLGT